MNRRRHLWTIAICLPLACVVPLLLPNSNDPLSQFIVGLILGLPAGLAGGGIALLLRRSYLTFDSQSRTIRGPSQWRNLTTYPRKGYERLEYSVYNGRIYEVSADGKRRKLFFVRWVADQRDWRVLVDLLLAPKEFSAAESNTPDSHDESPRK